jgi:2-polyprenyl-6-methoxyphenol hydroxylase-like FAD-dependent oxidoreductase
MQALTDALAHLFRSQAPVVRSARNLGLAAIGRMPPARRMLAQSALR